MAALPPPPRRPLSPPLPLLLLLLPLLSTAAAAFTTPLNLLLSRSAPLPAARPPASVRQPTYAPPTLDHLGPPVYSVAFTRRPDGLTAPYVAHNDSALNATDGIFIPTDGASPSSTAFDYAFVSSAFKYLARVPVSATDPGKHLLRLGLQDPTDPSNAALCASQVRVFRVRANSVYSKYVDPARHVSCRAPYYLDIEIPLWKKREILITMFKLPKFRGPAISSFQLFRLPTGTSTSNNTPPSNPSAPNSIPSPLPPGLPDSAAFDAGAPNVPIPPNASPLAIDRAALDTRSLTTPGLNIPPAAYETALQGDAFSLQFRLQPGTYDVALAFVETAFCDPGAAESDEQRDRVFSVSIDGRLSRLEAFNVYRTANGCGKAVVEVFQRQLVDGLVWKPLTIALRGIAGKAILSYVLITASSNPCTPVTSNAEILDDHLAHAVPGQYPPGDDSSYVDVLGRGYVDVTLDASGSHTHFSYPGGIGTILSYHWTDVESGNTLSRVPIFKHRFFLGSTRVRLAVVDNACTRDEAETTITVTKSMRKGQYCYYYSVQPTLPDVGTLDRWPRPKFAAAARATRLKFPTFPFSASRFVARCQFFVDFASPRPDAILSVHTGTSGLARVYRGQELVIDSETSSRSAPVNVPAGLSSFEILYQRTDLDREPLLIFKVDGAVPKKVSYDMSTVMPIVTSVFPRSGTIAGGSRVKLDGFGFSTSSRVFFGNMSRRVHAASATSTQVFVVAPPAAAGRDKYVPVFVQSQAGVRSNRLTWEYSDACENVNFEKRMLRMRRNKSGVVTHVPVDKPTAIATWVDSSLFIAQRDGRVRRVVYNVDTLLVESICTSLPIRSDRYVDKHGNPSPRTILGIAFDPRDVTTPRPYISVSTLFWRGQKWIDEDKSTGIAWSNGEVLRMGLIDPALSPSPTPSITPSSSASSSVSASASPSPSAPDAETSPSFSFSASPTPAGPGQDGPFFDPAARDPVCLAVEATVVSGLPVADSDHAVNELLFTDDGDLLIAVGGSTNAGLPAAKLGGKWDSFYSGAVLIARLSRGPAFNGVIPYVDAQSYILARPEPGYDDVDLYATGVRNLFTLEMSRQGRVYGVDMGPNCGFGNVSSTCSQLDPSLYETRHWIASFPGAVVADRTPNAKNCTYGPGRYDKVLQIRQSRFYGHPNLARGTYTERPWECAWIDPKKGFAPGRRGPPWNYVKQLAMIKSAKTGLVQYGANAFCGQLRNDLIFSSNTENGIWRLRLDEDGQAQGSAFSFQPKGGLRVVENVRGDLLFPLYSSNKGVYVARPKITSKGGLAVLNALPFRHGMAGGGPLTVAGWGFGEDAAVVAVSVGVNACEVTEVRDERIVCVMPALPETVERTPRTQNLTVTVGDMSAELEDAIRYMRVA